MVNSVNPQQLQGMQFHRPNPTEMFNDLSQKVGADDQGITRENLEDYLEKLNSNGKGDSKEADMISKLLEDFDNLSGGTDRVTADSMQQAFKNRAPQDGLQGPPPPSDGRFDFQDPSTITSDQLEPPIDIKI